MSQRRLVQRVNDVMDCNAVFYLKKYSVAVLTKEHLLDDGRVG
jgi:hypothetical protein